MRLERARLELRVELHRHEPRVPGQLRDLHELAVGRPAGDAHAFLGQRRLVQAVELEAMAMALVDQIGAVDLPRQRSGRQLARVAAQPHRAAELVDAEQIAQLVDHLVRRGLVDLGGIGAVEAAHVARVLHGGPLEAVADAEERDAVACGRIRTPSSCRACRATRSRRAPGSPSRRRAGARRLPARALRTRPTGC